PSHTSFAPGCTFGSLSSQSPPHASAPSPSESPSGSMQPVEPPSAVVVPPLPPAPPGPPVIVSPELVAVNAWPQPAPATSAAAQIEEIKVSIRMKGLVAKDRTCRRGRPRRGSAGRRTPSLWQDRAGSGRETHTEELRGGPPRASTLDARSYSRLRLLSSMSS